MDIASESLVIKRKVINRLMEVGLYPYTRRYLKSFDSHFSAIGINGMNECLLNFIGKDITSPEGVEISLALLDYMRDKMRDLQKETGDLLQSRGNPRGPRRTAWQKLTRNVILISFRLARQIPIIQTQLSFRLAIPRHFEALDHQDQIQTKYTGEPFFTAFLVRRIRSSETM